MAKRGRPSRKTLKKRKEAKAKSKRILFFGILIVIAFCVLGYYMCVKKVI